MIPRQKIEIETLDITESASPSQTYEIGERISQKIDGLESIKQFIHKVLSTEQGRYYIYDEYGIAIADLLGREKDYVLFELTRRIKECLERDERIVAVKDFKELKTQERDAIALSFLVETIYGMTKGKEVFRLAR